VTQQTRTMKLVYCFLLIKFQSN